jgi:RNA polymerase sigma-70 factor, ECF subfamily
MTNRNIGEIVVSCLPDLTAFARRLSHDAIYADDLVQETVVRALANQHQFHIGTSMAAWMTTILRHHFYSEMRHRRTQPEISLELSDNVTMVPASQEAALTLRDLKMAFAQLSAAHQQALLLVGAEGLSYKAAGLVAQCAVGTMKSRVSRARSELHTLM